MIDLVRAAPHIRLHRGKTFVLKAGGNTLTKPSNVRAFARQVALVHALGAHVVVVHGGGPQTDVVQRMLGESPRMVDGRRVTSQVALRALRMATAGELAGEVVAALAAESTPAVGVSGVSAGLLVAKRRAPRETSEGLVDFGEVGDLVSVDPAPLTALLAAGFVPVVCPPAGDDAGGFLNVNADLAAAALANALGATKLVLLTGARGVLRDPADRNSLVSALSLAELDGLEKSGAIVGGMKVKAAAIRAALAGGVERVHVVSGDEDDALIEELYTTQGAGTLVTREPQVAPTSSGVAHDVVLEPVARGALAGRP